MDKPELKYTTQGIQFKFPYSQTAVANFKRSLAYGTYRPIYEDRKFQYWLCAADSKKNLILFSEKNFGTKPDIIGVPKSQQNNKPETKLFEVYYIGMPKDRGNGQPTAYGLVGDNWELVFTEDVLRQWFECGVSQQRRITKKESFYALLAIPQNANGAEIKKAYRKMARRYHPDINKDDDAAERFIAVQNAYEKLSDPLIRRKYNACLVFEGSVENNNHDNWLPDIWQDTRHYRPPWRCGYIMARGTYQVGRFVVEKILQWEPITKNGFDLVTSWDKAKQEIVESWI